MTAPFRAVRRKPDHRENPRQKGRSGPASSGLDYLHSRTLRPSAREFLYALRAGIKPIATPQQTTAAM